VADTGEGIPASELSRVFERFYRVDKARARQTGGTGLGLAIVRHVAEAHGGTVRVESELGQGSTFTVTLPVSGPPTSAS
jgi:two-component system phosphate regulon sensor histidine kinase PhoR